MSKEKMNIEVSGVEVTIKGQKIKLTVQEARDLARALNGLLGISIGTTWWYPTTVTGSICASTSNAVSGA